MKTSALVLIVALAGLDPLATAGVLAAAQTGTSDGPYRAACSIPNVIGMRHDEATQRLRSADYAVSIQTRPSRSPRGEVIDQQPRRCADLDGRTIVLVVSEGPAESGTYDGEPQPPSEPETPRQPTRPPSSGGSSVGTAVAVGAAAAIAIAILASRNKDKSSEKEKEKERERRSEAQPDPPRTVARSAIVPAVLGMSPEEAQQTIAAAKLQMRTTNEAEATGTGSRVAAQVPSAGTPVVPGANVAVTFEAPPPPAPQPTPIAPPVPVSVVTPAPPSPPPAARTIPVPSAPVGVPTTGPVIPSSSITGLIDAPARIVPGEPLGDVTPEVPWLLILLALLLIAGLGLYGHRGVDTRSPLTARDPEPPPVPRFTIMPNLDPGEQRIVSGGASRSLDLSFNLDGGLQQIRCLGSRVQSGAVS